MFHLGERLAHEEIDEMLREARVPHDGQQVNYQQLLMTLLKQGNTNDVEPRKVESGKNEVKEAGTLSNNTASEKLMALISLQTALGHFREDKMMEDIFGRSLRMLKGKAPEKIDPKVWITSLVVAFIEKKFPGERSLWQLICDKAKALLCDLDILRLAAEALFE